MSTQTNLYDVLGVSMDAPPEEIRRAYRKKALQTHPDRLPQNVSPTDKETAEEQFRLVNNAYEILKNPENRKLYDKYRVWPPPTEQQNVRPDTSREPFGFPNRDPFTNDPFFSAHFGSVSGSRGPQYTFTDPFELFNSMFGDIHSAFRNDPFFANIPFTRSPFEDSFFRSPFGHTRDPFGGTPFSSALSRQSPLGGGMLGGSPFDTFLSGPSFSSSNTRVYSSTTQSLGGNGRFVSHSQTSRTINGRTESITKRVDADGNEYVTYSSPDGERHTINGIEQPRGTIGAPHRSNTTPISRQPPPAIAERPTELAQPPSFNIPISSSHRDSHVHAPPQPVQTDIYERRSSRRSHRERERAMTEDPRRVHHVAPIVTPSPAVGSHERRHSNEDRMDVDPPAASMLGTYATGDTRVRDKHGSHRSSRHSRTYGDATEKDKGRDRDAGSPTSTGSRRGGWRGWFSTVLHPFRRNHKEM